MALLSPGVELREVDLSEYTPRLAEMVFGVVGAATKGPVNVPTLITNELAQLTSFGPPSVTSHGVSAMLQYLRRGRRGIYVRVTDGTHATADVEIPGLATSARIFGSRNLSAGVNLSGFPLLRLERDNLGPVEIDLAAAAADPADVTLQEIVDAINAQMASFVVAENIETGDGLEVSFSGTLVNNNILPGTLEVTAGAVVAVDNGQGVLQGLGVVDGTIDYETGAWTITYSVAPANLLPITADYTHDAVAFKNATSEFLVIESPSTGAASEIEIQQTSDPTQNAAPFLFDAAITYPRTAVGAAAAAVGATIEASSPGTWANGYAVRVENYPERGQFRLTVILPDGTELAPIDALKEGSWDEQLNGPPALSSDIRAASAGDSRPKNGTYFLTGGADGIASLDDADYIGTIDPQTGAKSGLKLLDDPFSLDVNTLAVPGISSGAVVLEGIDTARRRQDAMFIADPPSGLDPQGVVDWHNGRGAFEGLHPAFNDSRGATYWPWVESFEPQLNRRVFTPPSGWVAGQYAYTDQVSDPWFAPAGLSRGLLPTALALEYVTDTAQRDFLYSGGNAVNPIADFTAEGIVIWGQRTLQRAPTALDRVNVRRMLNFAGKFIATATRRIVFEPSDPSTWRRLTALINPGLSRIAQRRGIRRFLVRIDETTNPPELINQNRIGGKIFVEPTKAGEFLEFDLVILPAGAEIPGL